MSISLFLGQTEKTERVAGNVLCVWVTQRVEVLVSAQVLVLRLAGVESEDALEPQGVAWGLPGQGHVWPVQEAGRRVPEWRVLESEQVGFHL